MHENDMVDWRVRNRVVNHMVDWRVRYRLKYMEWIIGRIFKITYPKI